MGWILAWGNLSDLWEEKSLEGIWVEEFYPFLWHPRVRPLCYWAQKVCFHRKRNRERLWFTEQEDNHLFELYVATTIKLSWTKPVAASNVWSRSLVLFLVWNGIVSVKSMLDSASHEVHTWKDRIPVKPTVFEPGCARGWWWIGE